MKENDTIKVIGGNNEMGQPTMIGHIGNISGFGSLYKVKGIETREVYVDFKCHGTHVFNDYHLECLQKNKHDE